MESLIDLSALEPLIGIKAWFRSYRPYAILLRPYGFIVYEEAIVRACSAPLARLNKKCIDTLNALRLLRVNAVYAGLKDADAFTSQTVTLKNRTAPVVLAYRDATMAVIATGCIERGSVRYNHFSVAVKGECKQCNEDCISPNYYGFQRFGTRRPNTHLLGKLLLTGDIGELLYEMIAVSYPREVSGKRGWYEERLSATVERTGRLADIARRVPRQLLELFVNAFQSYIFNKVLSKLVEIYEQRVCRLYPRILTPGCHVEEKLDSNLLDLYQEAINEEGLSLRDFCNARLYGIAASPTPRETCIKPGYAHCREVELRGQKVAIHVFSLPRGSYATIWLSSLYRLLEPNPDALPC